MELSGPTAELRILEVFYHKIYKVSAVRYLTVTLSSKRYYEGRLNGACHLQPPSPNCNPYDAIIYLNELCLVRGPQLDGDKVENQYANAVTIKDWYRWPDSYVRLLTCSLQIFPLNEKIENINDQYWTLRAEEVCHYLPF